MRNEILNGKKIIIGVTGCIAAYKSAFLVRELIKLGAEVKVVMTPSATQFITPLTLSTLSRNEVMVNLFPKSQEDGARLTTWHIGYALWADLLIIAPATINTVAKIANGFSDNALTTLVSALRCPLIISPAADLDMYENTVTQENLKKLAASGVHIIDAEFGELASGLHGRGRFPEINKIVDSIEFVLEGYSKDLAGKNILITAGPTYEDIDPVRFIGNRSSGKMGYQLAKAAYLRGAKVTLISGPSHETIYPEIKLLRIRSAAEMKVLVEKEIDNNDILIMSAAVSDFKPTKRFDKKIKKEEKLSSISLTENPDILASLESKKIVKIGFALETDNELKNAVNKLRSKKLDLVVLNSLKDNLSGFETDTNKITIIHKTGKQSEFPLLSKFQAANKILHEINKISS